MLLVPNNVREGDAVRKTSLTNTLKMTVIATAFSLLPMAADAAGLGKIAVLSGLGQPLRAEIELSASNEELSALSARLASHQAFKQAGIEYVPTLAAVKLAVDKRSSGQPVIRLTTDRPVNEPFLDMLIEISWSAGRLVREYTFLLDPPAEVVPARPAIAAPATKREQTAVAQPAPAPKPPEPRAEAPIDEKMLAKKAGEPAEAKPEAGEGGKREVKRGEFLRKIAAESKPDGVSLDQMLVALFRTNKDAFIGNNMHRLRAGKILTIPEPEAVAAVAPGEARKVISAQTADFNAYRMKLADAAAGAEAPKEAAAKQEAAGKITAKVEEKAPAAVESKDQLKVSKSETAKEARAAQGRIAALEEDLVAKDKALKEAQSRQAELERNVTDLKKVLEAKNQNLAELQKQAEVKTEAKKPDLVAAAPVVAVEPAKPAVPPAAVPEKPAEPVAQQPLGAKPAEPAKPEEPKVAEAAKPAPPPPAKKASPPPPPPPEPGFFDDLMENPAILGGGVLVLGLLGFIAYRQRQKRAQAAEAPPSTTANLASNSVFGATGGQSVDTSASSVATDFSQASISAIDAEEGVDPVAEADVYMAYGRDAQAEEILLDALKTDPTRTAIHVKLLEIYSARKNSKQFETLASDLYAQTGGVGADWEKAAAMGQKLDAANPLYGGGGAGASGESQSVSTDTTVIMPASGKVRDTWTMPGELGQLAEAVENGTATVILDKESSAAAEAPSAQPAGGLDFDLDLGAPAATPAVPAPTAVPAVKKPVDADLDFDLGLDFKPAKSPEAFSPDATIVMNVGNNAPAPTDLDIDLKLGDEPAAAMSAKETLHFDLDLGQATTTTPAAQIVDLERTIAGEVRAVDLAQGTAPPQPEPHLDLASINLELPGTEPAAADEVTTKLELAKAYEEMGDKEGARELLQEVVKEGSADQQEKARGILSRLG